MDKYVPFEKLSKKKKRELNAKRRGTWGNIDPVTRKPKNPKAYDRKKARKRSPDDCFSVPSVFAWILYRSLCDLAAVTVLRMSMAIVIGPTPPGTGVMADATRLTAS